VEGPEDEGLEVGALLLPQPQMRMTDRTDTNGPMNLFIKISLFLGN
jgi:hypothetical protein